MERLHLWVVTCNYIYQGKRRTTSTTVKAPNVTVSRELAITAFANILHEGCQPQSYVSSLLYLDCDDSR